MARAVTSQLIMELLDRVTGPAGKAAASMRGLNRTAKETTAGQVTYGDRLASMQARASASLDRARMGVLDAVGAYYALKGAIASPVQAAMRFESAMADVKKVIDFLGEADVKNFENGLLDMSRRIPIAVDGLAAIAAAAGQAGIAKEDILAFTEAAAKIGVAFDISAEQAGDAMAKLMTAMNLSLPDAIKLADAMNHLSNSQASSASDILNVVQRVGATAKQFGFTAEQVAAFGSAMLSSGAQSDVAATSFLNMGRALTRGTSATKRQRAAYKALGKDAEAVAKAMQEDAVGTTYDVIEAISKLPKEMQAAVASDLFGDEARALGPLLTNLDLLRASLGMVENEAKYAGSATKEFAARSATFENRMQLFNNTMTRLKVTIGNALIPILTTLMEKIEPVVDAIAKWADAHPALTGNIISAAGALIAFKGAIAGLKFVGLLGANGALALAAAGFKLLGVEAGASALAVEAAAGRIGRASVLASAGRLAAKAAPWVAVASLSGDTPVKSPEEQASYDESKTRLSKIADLNAAEVALEAAAKVQELRAKQNELLTAIQDPGTSESVSMDLSRQLLEVEAELGRAEEAATGTKEALAAVGMTSVSPTIDAASIEAALTKTRQLRADLLRINAAGGNAQAGVPIKGPRAKGGPISRGNTYLVGEDGPELMTASKSGYIHPNGKGIEGGGGQSSGSKPGGVKIGAIHLNPSLSFLNATMADAEAIAKTVIGRIKDELGSAMRGLMADVDMGF